VVVAMECFKFKKNVSPHSTIPSQV
jgi:hypothetical protein